MRLLRDLARNNDRSWFAPRKAIYERELLEPMRALVDELTARFARKRIPLGGSARRSIFRVYRDVRFRADKRPYRTSMAAYLSPDGERDTPGGLYVHVEPGESHLSLAFYHIDRALLLRWRASLLEEPDRFRTVLRALERRGLVLTPPHEHDDALRRLPRGIDAAEAGELAEYFRMRSFGASRPLRTSDVGGRGLVDAALEFVRDGLPLLRYGWTR
jgi:uncharacterized protein (TIGR02453 family)